MFVKVQHTLFYSYTEVEMGNYSQKPRGSCQYEPDHVHKIFMDLILIPTNFKIL